MKTLKLRELAEEAANHAERAKTAIDKIVSGFEGIRITKEKEDTEDDDAYQGFTLETAEDVFKLEILKSLHKNCTGAQILAIEEGVMLQMNGKYVPA
jgi:hypothetical protein